MVRFPSTVLTSAGLKEQKATKDVFVIFFFFPYFFRSCWGTNVFLNRFARGTIYLRSTVLSSQLVVVISTTTISLFKVPDEMDSVLWFGSVGHVVTVTGLFWLYHHFKTEINVALRLELLLWGETAWNSFTGQIVHVCKSEIIIMFLSSEVIHVVISICMAYFWMFRLCPH